MDDNEQSGNSEQLNPMAEGLGSALAQSPEAVVATRQGVQAIKDQFNQGPNYETFVRAAKGDDDARRQVNAHMMSLAMGTIKAPEAKIGVANKAADLKGVGTEYLQDAEGNIIGKFQDGNLVKEGNAPVGNTEPTAISSPMADGGEALPFDKPQSFAQSFNPANNPLTPPPTPEAVQAVPQQTMPDLEVPVINPSGDLVNLPGHQLRDALDAGYRQASPDEITQHKLESRYGTGAQQAITALEGAGSAATFGLSTAAERAMGVPAEDINARRAVNPGVHGLGQAAGLIGSALIPGVGAASVYGHAAEAGAAALGLGGAKFISQVGAQAVKGAFETMLFQASDEASKAFASNPAQTAESAISDIGLAGVMGGVLGGTAGVALGGFKGAASKLADLRSGSKALPPAVVSELDAPALASGEFGASVQHSNLIKDSDKEGILQGLTKQKADAPEIKAAAQRLGAPVLEGMVSDSPLVQKAEDTLINTPETYSGNKRAQLYAKGYTAASNAVDSTIQGAGEDITKAQLGNYMKDTISKDIATENAPIKQMYDTLKQSHDVIPLDVDAASNLAEQLGDLKELRISPSSPEGQLIKRVQREVGNLRTVDDIKTYNSMLNRGLSATASPGERRIVGILSDSLKNLEDGAVETFARRSAAPGAEQDAIRDLIEQRKVANKAYKGFMDKVSTLAEQLGKRRVYGTQDALNFIQDMTPEQLTTKLFNKNNSEFLGFFKKEFPQQMEMMKDYQKQQLKDASMNGGVFSPKTFFNKLNRLEPEIQKSIFSTEELAKIKDAKTYLDAFPKNFNPSGTAHIQAFREFAKSPFGAAIANARDLALEKFITLAGGNPEVSGAIEMAKATAKGWNTLTKASKAVFSPIKGAMPSGILANMSQVEKLKKMVDQYSANPDRLMDIGANNPIPEYATAFAATSGTAIQYLNSLKPNTDQKAPLDTKMEPNAVQKAKYDRAVSIAQQPLSVLNHLKRGTLLPQDIVTLKTIYPGLYSQISQRLTDNMTNAMTKGQLIPYKTRIGLSMMLMQPVDSTLTPQGIMGAQPMNQQNAGQQPPPNNMKPKNGSKAALNKLPGSYMTSDQARANRQQTKD